jgi:hypothetical protein
MGQYLLCTGRQGSTVPQGVAAPAFVSLICLRASALRMACDGCHSAVVGQFISGATLALWLLFVWGVVGFVHCACVALLQ